MPLYVDVPKLLARDYANLTHLYNPFTKQFNTTQIGGIVDFRTEIRNDGVVSLYGTARVPKRETEICERLAELYEQGLLNVSFEIKYDPKDTVNIAGVTFVDVGENNSLTGMAIVSVPACPDASAVEMVASVTSEETETTKVNEVKETMPEEKIVANENEETKVEEAIAEEAVAEEAVAEEANAEQANAETAEAEIVHESVEVRENVCKDEYDGKTYHTVSTEHTVVETVEEEPEAPIIAESEEEKEDPKDREIAELKQRIAELEVFEAELNQIKAERAEAEHAAKVEKASAFAAKQGLNVEDEAVKEAIANLNYEAIADLAEAMAAESNKKPEMSMASFVEMEPTGEYGGLLERR